jgi:polyisoprenyl-phosphate glycosyltransferase
MRESLEMPLITFIAPVFNEAENLYIFHETVSRVMDTIPNYQWDLLFVNDGSIDNSWDCITELAQRDPRVRGISLSRNFGKEVALFAGIDRITNADAVVFIDADLQHPPALVPAMIEKWAEGYKIIGTKRTEINHSLIRKIGSKLFYFLLNHYSDISLVPNSTDFRLVDAKVIKILKTFKERTRFFRGIVDWVGFKKTYLTFSAPDRFGGCSSFNFSRLVQLAINSITSFSLLPLRLAGYLGLLITSITFLLLCYMILVQFIIKANLFTPLAFFAVFNTFLSGIVLCSLGMIALYIGHIHAEVISRPLYIVQESVGLQEKEPLNEIVS